jgi:predicted neuraminidase
MLRSSSAGEIGLYDLDFADLDVADPRALARHGAAPHAVTPLSRLLALACWLALLVMLAAEWARWSVEPEAAPLLPAAVAPVSRVATLAPSSTALVPMPPGVPSAHASSLASLPGKGLMVFWWAGSRESGPDVKVYSARWSGGRWSAAREVASRESLGAALGFGVRRIGNPVAWTAADGSIHLYVVTTGLGGWAASRVVQMVSHDQGHSFKVLRLLPLSPLFNTSVLVRAAPVPLADGGWWLPMYFELGIKYPALMAFKADGAPRALNRIGTRIATLQPSVVIAGQQAHALMRDASMEKRVQHAVSRDGGATWQDLPALNLPNYSTSVAALRLTSGAFLLLHNHVDASGTDRNQLRLSISNDAHTWKRVLDVARGTPGEEFSYPTLRQIGDELHVTFTSRRTAIAHHVYRIVQGEVLP